MGVQGVCSSCVFSFCNNKAIPFDNMCLCVLGISRLQRWERAALHGLNPPQEIKEILLKENTDPQYTQRYYLWPVTTTINMKTINYLFYVPLFCNLINIVFTWTVMDSGVNKCWPPS